MLKKDSNLKIQDEELQSILSAHRTIIRVVGAGGAGNNTISHLKDVGINGVETIAVNTDAQDLLHCVSDNKILIGRNISHGLGAGSDPQIGEDAARENEEDIRSCLEGSDMVFVTCGLGGGTGTGAAPVIAEIARSLNALTIAVITFPFSEEGVLRRENALKGLEKLKENSDTVIVVQNNRLLDLVPNLPLNAAFKVSDEILVNAVKGITELVTEKGLINLDFADVRSIMKDGETAMIGIGESDAEENKAVCAVEKALENPLLDVDITGAKSALINITGDESMSISEARSIMVAIAEKLDANAKIIWGARIDNELKGKLRILLIATGAKSYRSKKEEISQPKSVAAAPVLEKFDPAPFFDIKEAESLPASPAQKTVAKPVIDDEPRPQKIFDQIFAEEIKGDLDLLKESLQNFRIDNATEKLFRNIKNSCVALQNSAQLFSNEKIEEFMIFISELFEEILLKKIKVNNSFVPYFKSIPKVLDGLVVNEDSATKEAQKIVEKLTLLIDQQDNRSNTKKLRPETSFKPDSSNIIRDELKIEQGELKTKLRMDLN